METLALLAGGLLGTLLFIASRWLVGSASVLGESLVLWLRRAFAAPATWYRRHYLRGYRDGYSVAYALGRADQLRDTRAQEGLTRMSLLESRLAEIRARQS